MLEERTDKQLVWEALKRIEEHTLSPGNNFLILVEDIWKDWSNEDKLRIRGLLLTNGLIHLYGNYQWAFQLTAAGMVLKESDLQRNGILKKKRSPELIRGLIIAAISALLGLATGTIQAKYLSDNQSKMIVLPKIQIIHDTIWAKKNLPKKL
jgi:hypothetical protein